MPKYFLFLTVIFFLTIPPTSAQIRSNRDLVGKWQGKDMQLEFFADAKVIMTLPGGKLPPATYTADFMRMPIPVTLTLTDNGQKMTYRGNLEFVNSDTIKLEYFGDDKGNTDAFAKGRSVTLQKQR